MKIKKILGIILCVYVGLSSFLMMHLWWELNSLRKWNRDLEVLIDRLARENRALRETLRFYGIEANYSSLWIVGKTPYDLYYVENEFGQRIYFASGQEALEYAIAHCKENSTIQLKTAITIETVINLTDLLSELEASNLTVTLTEETDEP